MGSVQLALVIMQKQTVIDRGGLTNVTTYTEFVAKIFIYKLKTLMLVNAYKSVSRHQWSEDNDNIGLSKYENLLQGTVELKKTFKTD